MAITVTTFIFIFYLFFFFEWNPHPLCFAYRNKWYCREINCSLALLLNGQTSSILSTDPKVRTTLYSIINSTTAVLLCFGDTVKWLGRWTFNLKVGGSSLVSAALLFP